MAAMELTNNRFQELLQDSKPLLVDYWAPWCGYCRRIGPAYDRIADSWQDKLHITKVNIDQEPMLADTEKIEIIPTLVLYRDGKPVGSIVAPESKAQIEAFIRKTLQWD